MEPGGSVTGSGHRPTRGRARPASACSTDTARSSTTAGTATSPPPSRVRPGEEIQLLCRDALDIGDQAQTITADGTHDHRPRPDPPADRPGRDRRRRTRRHPRGRDPRRQPAWSTSGTRRSARRSGSSARCGPRHSRRSRRTPRRAQLSDPNPGRVPSAVPDDQPFNTGRRVRAAVPLRARPEHRATPPSSAPTRGRRARIPVTPFMGILGNAPLRQGHVPVVPAERQRRHGRQHRRPAVREGHAPAAAGLRRGRQVLGRRRAHGPGRRRDHRHGDRDADVGHAAVLGHQEHRHHLTPRDRSGGRSDPAGDERRDARPRLLHHHRHRART